MSVKCNGMQACVSAEPKERKSTLDSFVGPHLIGSRLALGGYSHKIPHRVEHRVSGFREKISQPRSSWRRRIFWPRPRSNVDPMNVIGRRELGRILWIKEIMPVCIQRRIVGLPVATVNKNFLSNFFLFEVGRSGRRCSSRIADPTDLVGIGSPRPRPAAVAAQ